MACMETPEKDEVWINCGDSASPPTKTCPQRLMEVVFYTVLPPSLLLSFTYLAHGIISDALTVTSSTSSSNSYAPFLKAALLSLLSTPSNLLATARLLSSAPSAPGSPRPATTAFTPDAALSLLSSLQLHAALSVFAVLLFALAGCKDAPWWTPEGVACVAAWAAIMYAVVSHAAGAQLAAGVVHVFGWPEEAVTATWGDWEVPRARSERVAAAVVFGFHLVFAVTEVLWRCSTTAASTASGGGSGGLGWSIVDKISVI